MSSIVRHQDPANFGVDGSPPRPEVEPFLRMRAHDFEHADQPEPTVVTNSIGINWNNLSRRRLCLAFAVLLILTVFNSFTTLADGLLNASTIQQWLADKIMQNNKVSVAAVTAGAGIISPFDKTRFVDGIITALSVVRNVTDSDPTNDDDSVYSTLIMNILNQQQHEP